VSPLIEVEDYDPSIEVHSFVSASEPSVVENEKFKRSLDFMLFDIFTIYRKDKKKEPVQIALSLSQ
jgi:hypothetical protein